MSAPRSTRRLPRSALLLPSQSLSLQWAVLLTTESHTPLVLYVPCQSRLTTPERGVGASTQQPLDFTDSHPAYLGNSALLSSHCCYYMSPVTQNQYADTETTLSIPHRHERPANLIVCIPRNLFTLKMPLMNSFDLLSSAERSCSERRTKRATPWRIISHWGVSLRRCRKWLFVFRATDWLWSAEPREMLFTTDCTIRSLSLPLFRPQSHTLTLQLTALLKTKMIPPLSFLWHHHCWSLDVYLRALTLTHLPSQLRRRSWCCRAVEKQTERKDL